MHYEICNRCRLNALCICRTENCKRWQAIHEHIQENLKIMIDAEHIRYDNLQYIKG